MKDHWSELARQARASRAARSAKPGEEQMPFEMPLGFAEAVFRRLTRAEQSDPAEAWAPLLRPALGLAFATAFLCIFLQVRVQNDSSPHLLVETENLIRLSVLE